MNYPWMTAKMFEQFYLSQAPFCVSILIKYTIYFLYSAKAIVLQIESRADCTARAGADLANDSVARLINSERFRSAFYRYGAVFGRHEIMECREKRKAFAFLGMLGIMK